MTADTEMIIIDGYCQGRVAFLALILLFAEYMISLSDTSDDFMSGSAIASIQFNATFHLFDD